MLLAVLNRDEVIQFPYEISGLVITMIKKDLKSWGLTVNNIYYVYTYPNILMNIARDQAIFFLFPT